MSLPMLCDQCSQEAQFYTELSAFGSDPGYHVYHCNGCDRFLWKKLAGSFKHQQQQQQPRPTQKI